ncbi:hypothetical protein F4818DRAFT_438041 [Hypoxylon cercidicola]|nr:hypothetical protein F4818DRAFT_438041 [Hypoxylon cercidicola]
MEQPIAPQARAQPKHSKMNYACEACRSSKLKCQPGPQPGICKRCSEFKRECVFRTGPRTRRPRASRPDAEVLPPPPGPGKTFSIDFTMPADDGPRDDFDDLRERHERYIDSLVPQEDDDAAVLSPSIVGGQTFSFNDLSMPTPSPMGTTTSRSRSSTSAANSRPVSSLGIKPLFNLDSAANLLEMFRSMLPHCPCLVLPEDVEVRSMAREMPFVLLAILAVTSCSTSLQNHSLYDEEFRKILGLKFVAGGERSLELLQGLLIYCSWYPFHLRPKNRQLAQYLRMAVDMVHDLELDEETDTNLVTESPERKEARLQGIRAYLTCFYNFSLHSWGMSKPTSLEYTPWMARCCDTLEACSDLEQDHVLVWLTRLQYIQHELWKLHRARKKPDAASGQNEQYRELLRIGLETQLRDFQARIPGHLSTTPSILMASLNVDAYVLAAPLMQVACPRPEESADPLVDAARFHAATYTARAVLDYITSLSSAQLGFFSGPDMTRLILLVVLAYRLSFPMPACPGYDYAQGRQVLEFGMHLAKLSAIEEEEDAAGKDGGGDGKSGGANKKVDVVTAMRVVLGSVKAKFDKKSAELEAAAAAAAAAEEGGRRARMCPMFDGSLDQYLPLWEGQLHQQGDSSAVFMGSSYATSSHSSGGSSSAPVMATDSGVLSAAAMDGALYPPPAGGLSKPVFHDLWATMTMGWATDADMGVQQEVVDMAGGGDGGVYGDLMGLREGR